MRTPLHAIILISAYVGSSPPFYVQTPTASEYVNELEQEGLIEPVPNEFSYVATKKGRLHIEKMFALKSPTDIELATAEYEDAKRHCRLMENEVEIYTRSFKDAQAQARVAHKALLALQKHTASKTPL